jgi:hypothetical protein
VAILQRAGRRPVHVARDRPHLDELRAHAGQMAQAMTHVPPTGLERNSGEVIWADTLGGKWRRSRAGNQCVITWTFKSRPGQTYTSFSDNHEAASTWAGFREVCREAGITVLERAVSQNIELVTDQGTEFLGVFDDKIKRAGVHRATSTAYKTKKHGAQAGELANRNLQRFVRGSLMAARANFQDAGHDGRDYWDYATGVETTESDKCWGRVHAGGFDRRAAFKAQHCHQVVGALCRPGCEGLAVVAGEHRGGDDRNRGVSVNFCVFVCRKF